MSIAIRSTMECAIPGSPLADAAAGIDACVHCGFCLQACPTYLALEDENDSPRGRIVLMRALVDGTLSLTDPDVRTHIDRCLGCRACETACPSGVPYGHLLEATRETLTSVVPNPVVARVILFVFARAPLMKLAMLGGTSRERCVCPPSWLVCQADSALPWPCWSQHGVQFTVAGTAQPPAPREVA